MTGIIITIVDRSAINALARLQATAPAAIRRGLLKGGLLVGGAVARRAPRRTGRLARSFLVPELVGDTVLLGHGVPIWGAIHEYGGDIRPKNASALVFQVDGHWVRTQLVHIKEKRFARGGMEMMAPRIPGIIAHELANSYAH